MDSRARKTSKVVDLDMERGKQNKMGIKIAL
jgi:hypothetical protein